MRRIKSHRAAVTLIAVVAVYFVVAVMAGRGYWLSVFGNGTQAVLQGLAVWVFVRNARSAEGHRRAFWALWAAGGSFWLLGQMQWIYYENVLDTAMPSPAVGDVLFFIHTLPVLAATSLQPHAEVPKDDHRLRLGYLNFSLLLTWWLFLYGYMVAGHQLVTFDSKAFNSNFNLLYGIENVTVMIALAALWWTTRRAWRSVYLHLLIATVLYCLSSFVINLSIDSNRYYTGSIYDVPLVMSMAWYTYGGFAALQTTLQSEPAMVSFELQDYLYSRIGALAVLSLPIFAALAALGLVQGGAMARYRIGLTLTAMLLLMAVLFLKQGLLDKVLRKLLAQASDAYERLQKLQTQMLQAEKLVSVGQLVAGAAHEMNHPLTAIIDHSEKLATHPEISAEGSDYAEKILLQARRTKSLVGHLLTFAQQSSIERREINLNVLTERAFRLQELGPGRRSIEVVRRMDPYLPNVQGDENQLLQVMMHVLNNAVDAVLEHEGPRIIMVETRRTEVAVEWSCSDNGPGIQQPERIFDPFFTTKPVGKGTGLGLSASFGIMQEHQGSITCENLSTGGARFLISLPLTAAVSTRLESTAAKA